MRYVVDASVTNEAVPLCNSFHVTTRYCLLRRSATTSHLVITSEVVYDRPVFYGAKSIIESTCRSNLTDNFTDLVDHLNRAAQGLTEKERITGGPLARPYRPKAKKLLLNKDGTANSCSSQCKQESVGAADAGSKTLSESTGDSNTPNGTSLNHHHSNRGLSIPQVLLYSDQERDGRWLAFLAL